MPFGGQSAEVTEQQLQDSEWSKDSRLLGYSVVEGTRVFTSSTRRRSRSWTEAALYLEEHQEN